MRLLAIGDIHGCLRALNAILDMVRPQSEDLVVFLGDYVDRGPDSRGVLDRLIEMPKRCRCVFLRGNHDQMMLDSRDNYSAQEEWRKCGGKQALESYGGEIDEVPDEHWRFLEETQPVFESEEHFFVHANVYPEIPLDEQPEYMLYWEKLHADWSTPHMSGKTMICGHSAQRSGVPLDLGHAVCIDTLVYGSGWLTCLEVRNGRLWQAKQTGERRAGRLADGDSIAGMIE